MQSRSQDFYYEIDKTNPHSVIETWASNAYLRINRILRSSDTLTDIYTKTPSAYRYLKLLISYFDTYGMTKEQLEQKQISKLYRGIDTKFKVGSSYVEKGFMSTTWNKSVAKRFAKTSEVNGVILCYKTSHLPSTIKYVIIDTTIASYLRESEILFLPGFIEVGLITNKDACIQCKYTPSEDVINTIRTSVMPKIPKMRGGSARSPFNFERIVTQSLGMYLVYYRVRYQQPVEIFDRLDIPNTWEDAVDTIRFTKVKKEQYFENILEFIPEYVAIREASMLTDEDRNILKGYEIYPALYDPKTKEVLTTHYLLPSDLFYDLFDKKREKDVISAVKDWCSRQIF